MTAVARRGHRRGFSLLEMLIAIGLIIALVGAGFALLGDMLGARERLRASAARQRTVTMLFERIERDLATTMVGGGDAGAGVTGSRSQLTLLSRGVPVRHALDRPDEALLDLERTVYRHRSDAPLTVTRTTVNGTARPARSELSAVLHAVQFRFHDGGEWRDDYDALAEDALPRAIEVAIWFDPPPDAAESFAPSADAEDGFESDPRDEDPFGFEDEEPATGDDRPPDRVRVFAIPGFADPPEATADDEAFEEGGLP